VKTVNSVAIQILSLPFVIFAILVLLHIPLGIATFLFHCTSCMCVSQLNFLIISTLIKKILFDKRVKQSSLSFPLPSSSSPLHPRLPLRACDAPDADCDQHFLLSDTGVAVQRRRSHSPGVHHRLLGNLAGSSRLSGVSGSDYLE